MRLFEIDALLETLLNESVNPETGEIAPEALAEIEALEMALNEKALAVAAYIVGQECEAQAVKMQAKRLEERAAKHERHAARLREYLAAHLPPGTKLHDDRVEIGWRKSQAVEVDDVGKLPDELVKVTVTANPDKPAIRAALKAGEPVPGARLVERTHLVVK
jgi:hypothetical protein